MKKALTILIAAAFLYSAASYLKERIALNNDLDRSEFVRIRDTSGFNWTVKRYDLLRIEPGFLEPTCIVVRLAHPERAIIISPTTRNMVDMLMR